MFNCWMFLFLLLFLFGVHFYQLYFFLKNAFSTLYLGSVGCFAWHSALEVQNKTQKKTIHMGNRNEQ